MNIIKIIVDGINGFLENIFNDMITAFSGALADLMNQAINVIDLPLIQNTVKYTQILALSLLAVKVINEAIQTYILYQNGDPDADPSGILIRTTQAVAVIATLPWIVQEVFKFGTKVTSDIAAISVGTAGASDWAVMLTQLGGVIAMGQGGTILLIALIGVGIMFLIVGIQAAIRGAELGLMAILGPIMALNLTANNRHIWNAWFKELVIICTGQAIQIFMIKGLLALQTVNATQIFITFGWLWVTIKSPKFVKQFVYSTGLTGSAGGVAKQSTSIALTRMLTK